MAVRDEGPSTTDPGRPRAAAPIPDGDLGPPENPRAPVLVTCSTEFQNDGKLIRTTLEALAGENVEVVATSAGVDPSSFSPPPNARIVKFLPHGPVLERAACVVCHGGMGITQKALASGVPVCVVPFGRDQFDVARHVEVAGAGTRLPASRLRPDRLRAAVREAMGKKGGARRIASAFDAAGGPRAATQALEKLLNETSRQAADVAEHGPSAAKGWR